MTDRAIFFDVDGVLNKGFDVKDDSELLEPDRVKLLVDTAKKVNAVLVISSTWGMELTMLQRVMDALAQYGCRLYGNIHIYPNGRLIPVDIFPSKDTRIMNWLSNHLEIRKYVVLDDWDYSDTLGDDFIQTWCSGRCGLDTEYAQEIVKKFDEN